MADEGSEFKQFSYFIDNNYEPKKKNRFMLHIPEVPQLDLSDNTTVTKPGGMIESGLLLALMTANRPQYTVESTTVDRYNEQAFWAGKPSHSKELTCTFNDYIQLGGDITDTGASQNAGTVLYRWFNVVYNLSLGSMGYRQDYATNANLYLLDPHGSVVEHWYYTKLYPQDLNYETLEMASSDVCTISCVFKYNKAKLISAVGPMPSTYSSQMHETTAGTDVSGGTAGDSAE